MSCITKVAVWRIEVARWSRSIVALSRALLLVLARVSRGDRSLVQVAFATSQNLAFNQPFRLTQPGHPSG